MLDIKHISFRPGEGRGSWDTGKQAKEKNGEEREVAQCEVLVQRRKEISANETQRARQMKH